MIYLPGVEADNVENLSDGEIKKKEEEGKQEKGKQEKEEKGKQENEKKDGF